jgi:multiple sugar transport system permease protein
MSVTSLPRQASAAKVGTLGQREERLAYMMVAPSLLIVFLIVIFPFVWNIWLAFKSVELRDLATANLWDPSDLTLDNFERIFRGVTIFPLGEFDLGRFGTLLGTTLIYTFGSTFLTLLMGLAAALLARDAFPGRQIFRGTVLFPYIAPVVAVAFIWRMMLNAQFGVVNELGSNWFGMPRTDFLTQRFADISLFGLDMRWPLALSVVILFEGWRNFPFAFLFFLARLQALSPELYEAAAVDGAVPSQRLWYITLPQLQGVIGTMLLLRFIWTFNKFDDIFLLTGGAAGTEVIVVRVVNLLFGEFRIGAAAALALVLALVLACFMALYFRYVASKEEA